MKVLLDTHCLLWWLSSPEKLSKRALEIILDSDSTVIISAVVSWEITIKTSLKRLTLPKKPSIIFSELFEDDGFEPLAIEFTHTLKVGELSEIHSDPFDRLLMAQSLVEDIPILTSDAIIKRYPVKTVWLK